MEHSKLTNLVGEQAFGDLDFSMFKRRNATAHYHSSMNIMKRNQTDRQIGFSISPQKSRKRHLSGQQLNISSFEKKNDKQSVALWSKEENCFWKTKERKLPKRKKKGKRRS